jgi:putative tryptophan/tyrosine transport system substrate-binding protein
MESKRSAYDRLEETTMWRRTVGCIVALILSLLAAPYVAAAQPRGRIPQIGWLAGRAIAEAAAPGDSEAEAFLHGLRELGYVEGQNLLMVRLDAAGQLDRLPALAGELVRLPVDVIVTTGGVPATRAAMQATTTIPIVMAEAGDAVGTGLVASLARPGGNVTGLSVIGPDLVGKRLQFLKEVAPSVTRVAVLSHPPYAATVVGLREAQAAAPALGLTVLPMEVRAPDEFDAQFATLIRLGADALLTPGDPFTAAHHRRILDWAATHRLPTVCGAVQLAEAGCLMAYSPSHATLYRRAAAYVDKILKGAKPGDLPVEQPTKFELIINLKTAKALNLIIPLTLLFQADEVIR